MTVSHLEQVTLQPLSGPPVFGVFFGHACTGAFKAWIFDPSKNPRWLRDGSNGAGESVEFFLTDPSGNLLKPPQLGGHTLALNCRAASNVQRADRYSVRINITQNDLPVGKPLLIQGDLDGQGTAEFVIYVHLA